MEIKKTTEKLGYEAPVIRSMEVELEYGIATGSGGESLQGGASHQWNSTETQTQEVQNNHW